MCVCTYVSVCVCMYICIYLFIYVFLRLGRPRRRWEDNIKMDLQEVGGGLGTGWSWFRIGTGGRHLWVR